MLHINTCSKKVKRRASTRRSHYTSKPMSFLQSLFAGESRSDDVPLATLRVARRDSLAPQNPNEEELDRHLYVVHQRPT